MGIEQTHTVFRGRIIVVNLESVRLPNGHLAELEIIHHPGGASAVAIDAQRRVCLIRQYRHAAGGWIWELPAGRLEPSEPPLHTARRELLEETGTSAQNWSSLGVFVSSPGVLTETVHLYLAQELRSGTINRELAEVIEVHWIDLEEACARSLNGDINDGKTVVGLLRARETLHAAQQT